MMRVLLLPGSLACALVVIASCGPSEPAGGPPADAVATARSSLRVTMPPVMSGVEPSLQERIRASYASLESTRKTRTTSDVELGRAYGQVGKLLLAAELYDQAEPHLLNARALETNELAWPYYLAHAYRLTFQPAKAIPSFEEVLRIKPDHVPALVWLGTLRVDEGRADLAEPLLA
jgi:tetratricopeptide (TPR) repeat protein